MATSVPDQRDADDPVQRPGLVPITWDPDAVDSGAVYRRETRRERARRRTKRTRRPDPAIRNADRSVTDNAWLTLIAMGGPR